jgi:hypothetical protein
LPSVSTRSKRWVGSFFRQGPDDRQRARVAERSDRAGPAVAGAELEEPERGELGDALVAQQVHQHDAGAVTTSAEHEAWPGFHEALHVGARFFE